VFTQTVPAGAPGAQIVDSTRGIKLVMPANALTQTTNVTLEVLDHQRSGVTPQNYAPNANAINVAVDPASLAADGEM